MSPALEPVVAGWVELSTSEKDALKTQKAKANPSPRIFTLKNDSNNADGHFAKLGRPQVVAAATESINFLKTIGFVKA